LRIADLLRDQALLEEARRNAHALVTADPGLSSDEHAKLRRMPTLRPTRGRLRRQANDV
jgi:RecG-like helicase